MDTLIDYKYLLSLIVDMDTKFLTLLYYNSYNLKVILYLLIYNLSKVYCDITMFTEHQLRH